MDRRTIKKRTVATIANDCIQRVSQNRKDEDFPLSYYCQHKDGDCDFVFIEETLSSALVGAGLITDGLDEDANYLAAAAIVFGWLKETHGVNPPRWFIADSTPKPVLTDAMVRGTGAGWPKPDAPVTTVTLTLRDDQLDMLQAALDDYLANLEDDHDAGGDHAEALATGAGLDALLKKAVR